VSLVSLSMRRPLTLFTVAAFAFTLSTGPAYAKKKKKKKKIRIEMTGIKSFDKVFKQARKTDSKIRSAERNLSKSKKALRAALKLKKGTTYTAALSELKQKAKGKVKVAMSGKIPTLKAKEGVPEDIKNGIEAINTLSKSIPASINNLKDAAVASKKMVSAARKFPNRIKKELMGKGVDGLIAVVFKLPKITKTVMRNLKIMSSMPKRAAKVSKELTSISATLTREFR
jgi:hypothetical protein